MDFISKVAYLKRIKSKHGCLCIIKHRSKGIFRYSLYNNSTEKLGVYIYWSGEIVAGSSSILEGILKDVNNIFANHRKEKIKKVLECL